MTLLAIIAALWADRRFQDTLDLRRFSLYRFVVKTFLRLGIGSTSSWIPYVLATVLPALIVKMAISIIGFIFIIEIALWAGVLYLCLPPDSLSTLVKDYTQAVSDGNKSGADHYAGLLLGGGQSRAGSSRDQAISRALLSEQNMHIVGVFFWFSILGIGAAIFYKLNWILSQSSDSKIKGHEDIQTLVNKALGIMSWLPAKLMMIAFGLAGSFSPIVKHLFKKHQMDEDRLQASVRILADAGLDANAMHEVTAFSTQHVNESWALVRRANYFLLIGVVIAIVLSWF